MSVTTVKLNSSKDWKVILQSEDEVIVIRPEDQEVGEIVEQVWDTLIDWLEASDLTPLQIRQAIATMFPENADQADDCEASKALESLKL